MTDLRTAAQQALEALEDMLGWQSLAPQTIQEAAKGRAAALRAALVEDAMQKFTDVNQELEAALAEPAQEQPVCDECGKSKCDGWALYCVKCVEPMFGLQRPAEPVQEPVAWIHTDPDKPRVRFLEWRENEPGYRGRWIKTPLYAGRLNRT